MKYARVFVIAVVSLLFQPIPAAAQTPSTSSTEKTTVEKTALEALFRRGPKSLEYTQQMHDAISMERLENIVASIEDQLGTFVDVENEKNPYTLTFTNGEATAVIVLNNRGEVAGLQFTQLIPRTGSLEEAIDAFLDRPGETALTVLRDGEAFAGGGTDRPLAVGSSFKLAVLKALEDAVAAGRTSWNEVLTLDDRDRSLPSGVMQSWPAGSAVTVETAAILMISQSDNTATDVLIRHVGRNAVEAYTPDSLPLLTTREAFVLKADAQAAVRKRFLASTVRGRREILTDMEGELPPTGLFAGDPVHPEIEWFFTTEQLARLIAGIDRKDILGINPGPISAEAWKEYGYKGGSEPGVFNATLFLATPEGRTYSISASQNRTDADVDAEGFFSALQAIMTHLW